MIQKYIGYIGCMLLLQILPDSGTTVSGSHIRYIHGFIIIKHRVGGDAERIYFKKAKQNCIVDLLMNKEQMLF